MSPTLKALWADKKIRYLLIATGIIWATLILATISGATAYTITANTTTGTNLTEFYAYIDWAPGNYIQIDPQTKQGAGQQTGGYSQLIQDNATTYSMYKYYILPPAANTDDYYVYTRTHSATVGAPTTLSTYFPPYMRVVNNTYGIKVTNTNPLTGIPQMRTFIYGLDVTGWSNTQTYSLFSALSNYSGTNCGTTTFWNDSNTGTYSSSNGTAFCDANPASGAGTNGVSIIGMMYNLPTGIQYDEFTTTNGTITTGYLNASSYTGSVLLSNVTIHKAGYAPYTLNNTAFGTYAVTLTPITRNITFYDEGNNSLITGTNISLSVTSDSYDQTYTTTNGTIVITTFPVNNYTLRASGGSYPERTLTIETEATTNQITTMYLATSTQNVTFTVKDEGVSTLLLENAQVSMNRLISGTWTTVEQINTDIVGTAIFAYKPSTQYQFVVTRSGYTTKTFYLDPVQYDSYTILLTKDSSADNNMDFPGLSWSVSPETYPENTNTTITFTIFDPQARLTAYTITTTYPGGTGTANGNTATGSTLQLIAYPTNTNILDTVNVTVTYTTSLGTKTFYRSYPITSGSSVFTWADSCDEDYGMTTFEKAIVGTMMVLLLSALAFYYLGGLGGGIVALMAFYLATRLCLFNPYAVAGSIVVGIVIIAWRTSQ